jgi:5'-3' exoribonuclease 2
MIDKESPILDYYPENFEIDMNGKKMAWQGVALLPFIDQDRLLAAMATCYHELTEDERRRNKWGSNVILTVDGNSLYEYLEELYTKKRSQVASAWLYDNSGISCMLMIALL